MANSNFAKEIATLINRSNLERESNTPDFLLGEFLTNCLNSFNSAVAARDKWYGVELAPGKSPRTGVELIAQKRQEHIERASVTAGALAEMVGNAAVDSIYKVGTQENPARIEQLAICGALIAYEIDRLKA